MQKSKSIEILEHYNKDLVDIRGYIDFVNKEINGTSILDITDDRVKEIATNGWLQYLRFTTYEERMLSKIIKDKKYTALELFNQLDSSNKKQIIDLNIMCQMVKSWLKYKQIYKFDVDTLEMLSNTKQEITNEIIQNLKLPYDCFFIENEFDSNDGSIVHTTLVKIRDEARGREIAFYCFNSGDEKEFKYSYESYKTWEGEYSEQLKDVYDIDKKFINTMFNMLMYLAQPKLEILKKKSDIKERKNAKSFYNVAYDENEVGYKLGNAIRNYKIVYEKSESTNHKPGGIKKPHLRAGHFHHYWTGKGRTDLVVKYVEPTFVKGGANMPTLHKVGGKK